MNLRSILAVAASSVLFASVAHGDVILSLNDPGVAGSRVIIVDNAPAGTSTSLGPSTHADSDPTSGIVGVPGGLTVGNFSIGNTTTGFSFGGGSEDAFIDLMLEAVSTAAGVLEAMLTATDLSLDIPPESITAGIGGITDMDNVEFTAAFDPDNNQFGFPPGTTVGPVDLSGPFFDATLTTNVPPDTTFSLSLNTTVTASDAGQSVTSNGNNQTNPSPEPTSLAIWMVVAGVGLGVARRRRARGGGTLGPATLVS